MAFFVVKERIRSEQRSSFGLLYQFFDLKGFTKIRALSL